MAADAARIEWEPLNEAEQKMRDEVVKHFGADRIAAEVSEHMMLRFIRGYAREKDPLAKTLEKLEQALAWRKEFNCRQVALAEFERAGEFNQLWSSQIHGTDREGHPIYYEQVGKADPEALLKQFDMDFVCKMHVQMMERMSMTKELVSAQKGRQIYKHFAILDLQGLSRKHISSDFYNPLKKMIDIDQFFYPETLYKLYIINAPFLFKMFWAVVKPWLHPITQDRIKILGDDYLRKLLEHIDEHQLPKILGGTCDCEAAGAQCPRVQLSAMVMQHVAELREADRRNEAQQAQAPSQEANAVQTVAAAAAAASASASASMSSDDAKSA